MCKILNTVGILKTLVTDDFLRKIQWLRKNYPSNQSLLSFIQYVSTIGGQSLGVATNYIFKIL